MECPIGYTSEQIVEMIEQGGVPFRRLENRVVNVLSEDQRFVSAAYAEVMSQKGSKEDAEDNLQEAFATFLVKLREGRIRILPGDLLPYYAFKLTAKRLKAVLKRKGYQPKGRLHLRGRSPLNLWLSSEELIDELDGPPEQRRVLAKGLVQLLRDDIEYRLETVDQMRKLIERAIKDRQVDNLLNEEEAEQSEDIDVDQLIEEVMAHSFDTLTEQLFDGRYNFSPDHLIPTYVLGINKFIWKNKLRALLKFEGLGRMPGEEDIDDEFKDVAMGILALNPAVEELAVDGDFYNPSEKLINDEDAERILAALDKQNGDCPKILRLVAQGSNATEIAEKINRAVQTVHNNTSRCRKKFRAYLKSLGLIRS